MPYGAGWHAAPVHGGRCAALILLLLLLLLLLAAVVASHLCLDLRFSFAPFSPFMGLGVQNLLSARDLIYDVIVVAGRALSCSYV